MLGTTEPQKTKRVFYFGGPIALHGDAFSNIESGGPGGEHPLNFMRGVFYFANTGTLGNVSAPQCATFPAVRHVCCSAISVLQCATCPAVRYLVCWAAWSYSALPVRYQCVTSALLVRYPVRYSIPYKASLNFNGIRYLEGLNSRGSRI